MAQDKNRNTIILGDDTPVRSATVISKPVYVPPVVKAPEASKPITVYKEPVKVEKPAIIFSNKPVEVVKETPKENMTAFGKTIVGKILKGAAIAGGSILGLGAITGVVKGVGAVAGAGNAVSGVKNVIDKVGASAVNLVTGTTKAEREQVKEVKAEAKEAADKLEQMNRLVKAGASVAQAKAMAGINEPELTEYEGKTIQSAGFGDFFTANKKTLMIVGGVIAGLFLLPRILKRR